MTSASYRNVTAEAAKLEAIAASAGSALACVHESAEEMHRSLVRDYLQRKQERGFWSRLRSLSLFALVLLIL